MGRRFQIQVDKDTGAAACMHVSVIRMMASKAAYKGSSKALVEVVYIHAVASADHLQSHY
jgi:hypothetical protein